MQLEGNGHKEKKGGEVEDETAARCEARFGARMHAQQKNGGGTARNAAQTRKSRIWCMVLRNLRSYSARCRVSPLLRCVRVAVEEGWGGGGKSIRV